MGLGADDAHPVAIAQLAQEFAATGLDRHHLRLVEADVQQLGTLGVADDLAVDVIGMRIGVGGQDLAAVEAGVGGIGLDHQGDLVVGNGVAEAEVDTKTVVGQAEDRIDLDVGQIVVIADTIAWP